MKFIPAAELSLAEQALGVNAAFANYIAGWTEMNAEALARFLMLQGADLFLSRFVETPSGLAGMAYVNRTGEILRLGAMAVIPSARGTGAAGALLEYLCAEAKARGDASMVLEVIQQNPPAVGLYRKHGFREIGSLSAWRRAAEETSRPFGLTSDLIPTLRALQLPNYAEYPDIPWPTSRHAIARVERTRAYQIGEARIVLSATDAPAIRVHGLLCLKEDWKALRDGLVVVMQLFPGREFFAPPVWPEDYGREVFEPLGFVRQSLSQFFMRRDFR